MAIFNTVYGGEWHWKPWSNTVAYYNINDNDTSSYIYDLSWNNYTQTWHWTAWYDTDATYWRVATFNWSSYTQASSIVNFWSEYTFIALFKTTSTSNQAVVIECAASTTYPIWLALNNYWAYSLWSAWQGNSNSNVNYWTSWEATTNSWTMLVWTRDSNWTGRIYKNWTLLTSWTVTSPNYSSWEALQIGRWRNGDACYLNWVFKLFIWENRCWNDADIQKIAKQYGL